MTVKVIKAKLVEQGLATNGNKQTLLKRLEAANKPKTETKKEESAIVRNIRQGAEALYSEFGEDQLKGTLHFKPFNSNPKSFVLRLPSMRETVKRLPESKAAKEGIAILRKLRGSVTEVCGDADQTWVFHSSGAFGLYSHIALK